MNKKKKEEAILLTPGSKYIIRSLEARDKPLITVGLFRGYTALGGDDAICMELDESMEKLAGKTRIIPCHMIMAIDVMAAAEPEARTEDETQHYFG
jgi:hypothetical protein